MRLVERLHNYLEQKKITVYAFEKACGVANGYLGKQLKGKGSIGSDILEKVAEQYPDLSLNWLITGKGNMLQTTVPLGANSLPDNEMQEEAAVYAIRNELITVLKEQLQVLESSLQPKDKKNL